MVSSLIVAYRIDSTDCFTTVNEGWVSFAMANGGERLLPPGILGTSLWPWIVDPTTREVYRSLVTRVRKGAGPVRFQFRCDGPDRRRLLQMQITLAASDDVDFQTTILRDEPRAEVSLMDPATLRSDALLTICGWCMRVPVGGKWLEIEEAVPALGLLEAPTIPHLSHGMCPACYDTMLNAIENPEPLPRGRLPWETCLKLRDRRRARNLGPVPVPDIADAAAAAPSMDVVLPTHQIGARLSEHERPKPIIEHQDQSSEDGNHATKNRSRFRSGSADTL